MMYGYGYVYEHGHEFMRGGVICMMIFGLIIIGAVVYFVLKGNHSHIQSKSFAYNNNNSGTGRALEILNEKFANGEISEEEYSSKKKLISGR
jgi:putative membrane protein